MRSRRADEPLTTSEVARHCHVSHVTVWKWIKQGKLQAYRLRGGPYRIEKGALRAFLLERGLPIDPDFFARPIKRILVVDDEAAMLEIIVRPLHQIPHIELATASDGFEAGLQVATFKPDLLVLDLMMPHADGFEVCRFIRRNPATAHIKILVITAFGSHENIQRALDAGANDFMHKPLQLEQLSAKVRALLAEE